MSGFSTSLTAVKFVSLHSSIHTFLSGLSAKHFLGYTVTNSTIQSFYNLPMDGFVHFNSSSYHNLDLVIRRTAIICVDSKWHGKVTLFPIKLITSCHVCLGQSHSWPFGIPLCRRSGAALSTVSCCPWSHRIHRLWTMKTKFLLFINALAALSTLQDKCVRHNWGERKRALH